MHPPPDERLSVYAFDDTVGLALLRIDAGLYSNQFSAVCPKYDNGTGKRYSCRDALPDFATRRLLTRLRKVVEITEGRSNNEGIG